MPRILLAEDALPETARLNGVDATVRSKGDGVDDGSGRRRGSTEERGVAIDPRIVVTP